MEMSEYFKRKTMSIPFHSGDINPDALKEKLRSRRLFDEKICEEFDWDLDQLNKLSEDQLINALNQLLEVPHLIIRLEGESLQLSPIGEQLKRTAKEAFKRGTLLSLAQTRSLNRSILEAIYPDEIIKFRQHHRFSSKITA